jgi:hypothetical protein
MTKRIVLSCEEIYSRIVKRNDSASYYYYTEPFKEKVFFFPLLGFYDQWVKGNVREIILVPHITDPERMVMMDFKTYNKKKDEKSTWDDFD